MSHEHNATQPIWQPIVSERARRWAWKQEDGTVSERLVLLALAHEADNDGFIESLPVSKLRRYTRLSTRGVQGALRKLTERGQVVVGFRSGEASSYQLNLRGSK